MPIHTGPKYGLHTDNQKVEENGYYAIGNAKEQHIIIALEVMG